MALTDLGNGTQAATVSTEHTLHTEADAHVMQLNVDLNAMDIGDRVVLRVKTRVLTGGTTRLAWQATFRNVQSAKIAQSIPVNSLHEAIFTLEQTDGTGRSFPWTVVALQ